MKIILFHIFKSLVTHFYKYKYFLTSSVSLTLGKKHKTGRLDAGDSLKDVTILLTKLALSKFKHKSSDYSKLSSGSEMMTTDKIINKQ